MKTVPETELKARIESLSTRLAKERVDIALIVQHVDRFYFTGTMQDGVFVLPQTASGSGFESGALFVKRTLSRAKAESPLPRIFGLERFARIEEYVKDCGFLDGVIGVEADVIPASLYLSLKELWPRTKFVDISPAIREIRAVKSSFEIDMIREAGRRLDRVFARASECIQCGMTEYELYSHISGALLKEGAGPFIRARRFNMEVLPCFVLSGPSAAKHSLLDSPSSGGDGRTVAYPAGSGNRKIEKREPILIDMVFSHEGYQVDCARVFSIGEPAPKYMDAHEVSKSCHELFREAVSRGKRVADIDRELREKVAACGLEDVFMGSVGFIGHGIGLELDEFPIIFKRFPGTVEEGMVVAFEPKFVFDGGTVGYETTYAVENGECTPLNVFETAIGIL
ncbi:MAG: aminopeptidase P family protein [Spirochaetes bacterium]|nr:aminopeptidase P family protein [Spirochaetota bacterium]